MLAGRIHDQNGLSSLKLEEVDRPSPGPNEVLVDVHAASLNPMDTLVLNGEFSLPEMPGVLGGDLAGVVEATGPGVEEFEPGDRVYGAPMSLHSGGTFAEYSVVPTDRIAPLPAEIPFEDATAIVSVGTTAYRCLVDLADLNVGESCLVHGGSGGVGHAAVQLAAAAGAEVVATAGSERARERVRAFGADAVFSYDDDHLATKVKEAATGGIDVTLDHRLDDYLSLNLEVAASDGRIVGIYGDIPATSGKPFRRKGVTIYGRSGEMWPGRKAFYETTLTPLLQRGVFDPEIHAVYPLSDLVEAQRALQEDSVIGKLVVVP